MGNLFLFWTRKAEYNAVSYLHDWRREKEEKSISAGLSDGDMWKNKAAKEGKPLTCDCRYAKSSIWFLPFFAAATALRDEKAHISDDDATADDDDSRRAGIPSNITLDVLHFDSTYIRKTDLDYYHSLSFCFLVLLTKNNTNPADFPFSLSHSLFSALLASQELIHNICSNDILFSRVLAFLDRSWALLAENICLTARSAISR